MDCNQLISRRPLDPAAAARWRAVFSAHLDWLNKRTSDRRTESTLADAAADPATEPALLPV